MPRTRGEKWHDEAIEIDGFGAARSAEDAPSQIPADRLETELIIKKHEIWMALNDGFYQRL
jgi:hypothetical protein